MNEQKPLPRAAQYETDLYAWSNEQAQRLRLLKPDGIDWENVAEEIESLGRSDKRAVGSNLNVVLKHLIKWRYQPDKRSASWQVSSNEHRDRLQTILRESPSLASTPASILQREYVKARQNALIETGLTEKAVPKTCPFAIDEVLDRGFLP
jgi:hypothetical protein